MNNTGKLKPFVTTTANVNRKLHVNGSGDMDTLFFPNGANLYEVGERLTTKSQIDLLAGVGTGIVNLASLDSVNGVRLYGTSTVWKDIVGPFESYRNGGNVNPAFTADSATYHFTVDSVGGTTCKQYYSIQLNHDWQEGSTIYPHVHYVHNTSQGTPTFIIKYRWVNTGQTPGAYTWKRLTSTTGTTNHTLQMNYATIGISGAGKTISSILDCQVYLYSQTGTGGVEAKSFDLHYEIDALGSNTETSKN